MIEVRKLQWRVKLETQINGEWTPAIWIAEGPFWDYEVHLMSNGQYMAWEAGAPFDTLEKAQQYHQDQLDEIIREWVVS